tara:strand:- start:308 stop:571 length:264 start_codon:yes stop_codon:yes gene_type:complete
MEPVWIAFACGMVIGAAFGILSFSIILINRDQRLERDNEDLEDRVQELIAQRKILKEEIFRLTKNYKPRKPQPRKRRNYKKNQPKKG